MAKLTTAARSKLRTSSFAGPKRSFPIHDKSHARFAIGAATRSMHAGNISASTAKRIQSKARSKLRGMNMGGLVKKGGYQVC